MMYTVLFYYTLIIMLFYTIVAATSFSAYFVSRRRSFLFIAIGFIFYFFDVSLVFKDDFVTPDAVFKAETFWEVGNPLATIITGFGTFLFLWMATCYYIGEKRKPVLYVPIIVWTISSSLLFVAITDLQWREFMFYLQRELLLFFSYAFLAHRYITTKDESIHALLGRHRHAFFIALVLTIGIILENIYFQLLFDASETPNNMWFFAERNPMENMLFICFGVVALRNIQQTLQLRYEAPPQRDDATMAESIDRILPLYCKNHGLSKRESEVLRLIIMGKDNQNIASVMQLALSTVKVHVHNILKKTGQPDRKTLAKNFWSD